MRAQKRRSRAGAAAGVFDLSTSGTSGPSGGARHRLLDLQEQAGNKAVADLVQRFPFPGAGTALATGASGGAGTAVQRRYISSSVALAVIDKIYKGKCDAKFDNISLNYSWSPGMLANDTEIEFICGPETFTFSTSNPWGSDRFPWGIELAVGGTSWVTKDIEKALDTIDEHWDDEGGGFWDAVRKVKAALKYDLDRFCAS